MTITSETWTDEMIDVARARIQLIKGGTGEPLLVLHDELGHPGWMRYHQALAQDNTIYVPSPPGFGKSERLDWIMNIRDMAGWCLQALDEMGLDQINVMGFSLGGWLASEMATMSPDRFNKMVLVGAMGIKPPVGEIYDIFVVLPKEYLGESFHDADNTPEYKRVSPDEPTPEQIDFWEVNREEACRLGWKPYMYYRALPHLLGRLKNLPTLIVWGKQDKIVPISSAEVYHNSIQGSKLVTFDECGHHPELEKTDEFVSLVQDFLSND